MSELSTQISLSTLSNSVSFRLKFNATSSEQITQNKLISES